MKNFIKQCALLLPLLAVFVLTPHHIASGEMVAQPDLDQSGSVEERRILASLLEEKARVAAQKKLLDAREMELKTLQTEVDKKLDELKRLREEVEVLVAQKDAEENARILELSKMYEKMEPAKAARVLTTLETELAVEILANMKQKSAGKILNNIEGEKAAALSVAFSTLQ
jgi:flagellar motility protein MotE (MotC chaperone)